MATGACVGGGVKVVAACDIRCCSKDVMFVLKEVDMVIVADLGALQQLPRIVGYGNAADLALTGRRINAMEAKEMGLIWAAGDVPTAVSSEFGRRRAGGKRAADVLAAGGRHASGVPATGRRPSEGVPEEQVADGVCGGSTWTAADDIHGGTRGRRPTQRPQGRTRPAVSMGESQWPAEEEQAGG
ncbi:delta(3,5)-Delta(2,4)-dienoyl-CoA isomerase, peroxisomal-like [Oryza brachyantha]|uniref:delta(3,5)-Delta(2,4)-dienoyl-CoA isomerase, peroxisomal-like n=1 Tax=Oryza brachyantha TaxID=4533 RepID=UPI001ADD2030|nr:delta(3,5)-Delta(2,4)-dienoyl-CoA isomerase, peroxisomal-like [Oryza brachyantha]